MTAQRGGRRRRRVWGALCPVCKTVQSWTGDDVYKARLFCHGAPLGARHDIALVEPFTGVLS